jgi:pimeloyl-ACP methyl ester carboxylesterase
MEVIRDPGPAEASPLILLPGAYMHARDFVEHGFIPAARRIGQFADIAAIETGMEAYLDGSIVWHVHEVIAPTRKVWLGGISLGGLGALLYARAHPETVAGLLLLSPFIGTRGAIAQVIRAGGFDAWQSPVAEATSEHTFLDWLRTYRPGDAAWPDIYLGYGKDDRFAASYRLLAGLLPADRVATVAGGHDWETWTVLWDRLLGLVGFTPG